MKAIRSLIMRLCAMPGWMRRERELAAEIECHLAMHVEDNIRMGMRPEEARRVALVKLGGVDKIFEEYRERRGFAWIGAMLRHFRHALRRMLKAPVLSITLIGSLGLGIGANTAMFSAMHQTLWRALPVERPEEIALVATSGTAEVKKANWNASDDDSGRSVEWLFSYPGFRELERQRETGSELAGFKYIPAAVSYADEVRRRTILMVSGGYFGLMRVQPLLGRAIAPEDDRSAKPVAMLGYDFWKKHLGGRTDLRNLSIRIFGQPFTVIGIAPKEFYGTTIGAAPDVFIPLAMAEILSQTSHILGNPNNPNGYWLYLVARIDRSADRRQIEDRYAGAYATVVERSIDAGGAGRRALKPREIEQLRRSRIQFQDGSRGQGSVRERIRPGLGLLLAVTALVLLIALGNAANLLYARFAARRRELYICTAVGASRGTIVGQLLSESLAFSILGGLIALPLALLTLRLLNGIAVGAGIAQNLLAMRLEWPVFLYGVGLALLTGILMGLYPAWEEARAGVAGSADALDRESGHLSENARSARVRRALVCAQIMISAILLLPAGLLLKSMVKLMHVDPGLRTEHLVAFSLTPDTNGYASEQSQTLYANVERELGRIPGAKGVAAAAVPLLHDMQFKTSIRVDVRGGSDLSESSFNSVSPGFFAKMGIPLRHGREFTEADNLSGRRVAVINECFARTFFPGQNPIGRLIRVGGRSSGPVYTGRFPDSMEIVGIAKDSSFLSVGQKPLPAFYIPCRQHRELVTMTYYVRTDLPDTPAIHAVRKTMRSIDAGLALHDLGMMEDHVRRNTSGSRFLAQLAGISAGLAMLLAMIGLYGTVSYSVICRRREIGIRIAVGAERGGIFKMVLGEALGIFAVGLAAGLPLAYAAASAIESRFFEVRIGDPLVLAGAALALGLAASAVACYPALRASRIDPMMALRTD